AGSGSGSRSVTNLDLVSRSEMTLHSDASANGGLVPHPDSLPAEAEREDAGGTHNGTQSSSPSEREKDADGRTREGSSPTGRDLRKDGVAAPVTARQMALHRQAHGAWRLNGRDEQQPPPGDWRTWLLMGGRGSGKTRAGAEW